MKTFVATMAKVSGSIIQGLKGTGDFKWSNSLQLARVKVILLALR